MSNTASLLTKSPVPGNGLQSDSSSGAGVNKTQLQQLQLRPSGVVSCSLAATTAVAAVTTTTNCRLNRDNTAGSTLELELGLRAAWCCCGKCNYPPPPPSLESQQSQLESQQSQLEQSHPSQSSHPSHPSQSHPSQSHPSQSSHPSQQSPPSHPSQSPPRPLRSILKKSTSMDASQLKSALKPEGGEDNGVKKQARIACRRYPSGEMVPKFEYITQKTAGKKHRENMEGCGGDGGGGVSRKRSFDA